MRNPRLVLFSGHFWGRLSFQGYCPSITPAACSASAVCSCAHLYCVLAALPGHQLGPVIACEPRKGKGGSTGAAGQAGSRGGRGGRGRSIGWSPPLWEWSWPGLSLQLWSAVASYRSFPSESIILSLYPFLQYSLAVPLTRLLGRT